MIVRLLKLLVRRRSPPRELFVHEDDWGQIEVLPASCAAWCAQEMARLSAFAAEHEAPGGNGWTECTCVRRPESPRRFGHPLRRRREGDGRAAAAVRHRRQRAVLRTAAGVPDLARRNVETISMTTGW